MITSYWAVCSVVSGDLSDFIRNPGPKIRGALGYCLKEVSRERQVDLLHLVFKPYRRFLGGGFMLRKLKHPPPPFTIPPPKIVGFNLLEIGLRFYGRFGLESDLIVYVMKRFEDRVFPGNVRLSVEEVYSTNDLKNVNTIHFTGHEFLESKPCPITFEDVDSWARDVSSKDLGELRIHFLTPFMLLREGKPVSSDDLRPSDIVRYLLRRIFLLEYLYNGRTLPWMNPTYVNMLKDEVDGKVVLDKRLKNSGVRIKGIDGFLEGNITIMLPSDRSENSRLVNELLRCLKIGEYVGVGKNTSYGFGQYKIMF